MSCFEIGLVAGFGYLLGTVIKHFLEKAWNKINEKRMNKNK